MYYSNIYSVKNGQSYTADNKLCGWLYPHSIANIEYW